MQHHANGILIAVEGIDGSGKSTVCASIAQSLKAELPALLTKEPGGTELGMQLRAIVQQPIPRCSKTEFLLFAADRAQHFEAVVLPALERNMIVISDRMADSSLVYQGYGRGLDATMITQINHWAMNNRLPDITLYIRIPLAVALSRIKKRNVELTAFEQENHLFLQKLIDGFDHLYTNRPDVIIIDGTQTQEIVHQQALQQLHDALAAKGYRS